ncbi:hypothetical protein ABTY20_28365 [Streptomyces sp. NPDC126497]|uniref:hypothetical protein n=1 Tax=Streptomyces sp. NPDC126497 TaxID=3155313 RepID=UPI00331D1947
MRHVKNILTTACAAAALLALPSCAGSGDDPGAASREPAPGRHAQPSPAAETNPLPLPVHTYLLAPSRTAGVRSATIILVNACLREQDVPPLEEMTVKADGESDPDPYQVGRRYGPIVEDDVLTHGYHLPPDWTGNTSGPPEVSARQEAAMDGPSGCLAVARRELFGENSLDSPTARKISSQSFKESLEDPKVKAVTAEWSACMTKKGHAYTDPLQALSKADLSSPKPSKEELRVAAADYSCKESTDLIPTWQAVEARIQNKEIKKNLADLKKETAQRDRIMAKADKIVEQGG